MTSASHRRWQRSSLFTFFLFLLSPTCHGTSGELEPSSTPGSDNTTPLSVIVKPSDLTAPPSHSLTGHSRSDPAVLETHADVIEADSDVSMKDSDASEQDSGVSEKDTDIGEKETDDVAQETETGVREKETDVREKETDVREKETDVREKETDVREKVAGGTAQDMETNNSEKEIDVSEKKTEISEGKTNVLAQERTPVVSEKDIDVSERESDVSEKETDVSEKETSGDEKETGGREKETDINEKEINGSENETDGSEKENDVSEKKIDFSEKETGGTENETGDSEKETDVCEKEADVNEKEINVNEKETDVSEKETDDSVTDLANGRASHTVTEWPLPRPPPAHNDITPSRFSRPTPLSAQRTTALMNLTLKATGSFFPASSGRLGTSWVGGVVARQKRHIASLLPADQLSRPVRDAAPSLSSLSSTSSSSSSSSLSSYSPSFSSSSSSSSFSLWTSTPSSLYSSSKVWYNSVSVSPSCPPIILYLEGAENTIDWTTSSLSTSCEPQIIRWRVRVPEGFGYVVEFGQVFMEDDSLEIYTYGDGKRLHRQFSNNSTLISQTTLSPLFLRETNMEVVVNITYRSAYKEQSHFNLSIKAQPIGSLPMHRDYSFLGLVESYVTYDCSKIHPLPDAIACDGVVHCDQGEDERNCSYRQQGCGDWVPYNHHCLKAWFQRNLIRRPRYVTVTMPIQAEEYCQSKHGATLALLPDPAGKQIVTRLIRASGYNNAVVGLRKVNPVNGRLRHLRRYVWQWGPRGNPLAYEVQELQRSGMSVDCAMLSIAPLPGLQPVKCTLSWPYPDGFVCMRPNPLYRTKTPAPSKLTGVRLHAAPLPLPFPVQVCADGSLVQPFHSCQWGSVDQGNATLRSPGGLPMFQCRFGQTVHYSLLCDGKDDCADRSDELFCQVPHSQLMLKNYFICRNSQVVPLRQRCDATADCFDDSDEESCASCREDSVVCPNLGCTSVQLAQYIESCPTLLWGYRKPIHPYNPATVLLDGLGMSTLENASDVCPEEHFQCHSSLCVPAFLVNDGEKDCPQGEDEGIPRHNVTCPGFYRCQGLGTCLHPKYVCDGFYHCPNKDDERFCNVTCPQDQGCICEGQAYTCSRMIDPLQHLLVRYLDLSGASDVRLDDLHFMEYLVFLNMSSCHLDNVTLVKMPQLLTLDLSSNSLTFLTVHLQGLTGLQFLDLSHNPLSWSLGTDFHRLLLEAQLTALTTLVLVNVGLEEIESGAFTSLAKLQHLDIRSNPLSRYRQGALSSPRPLQDLYTDLSKLCCSHFFHTSPPRQCHAPVDELSSCSDLLARDVFRVCLWTLAVLAIVGNAAVFISRLVVRSYATSPAFGLMVQNLCASDLLMGVYLAIIGAVDALYKGEYVAREEEWKLSALCTAAGVMSFVSSEVSAFLICLITVDRALAVCFPLHVSLRFTARRTVVACVLIWLLGLSLALVPVLCGLQFYGQSGICLPLPITRRHFPFQSYAFGVFIVLNFVLFLFIGAGQLLIYFTVRRIGAAMKSASERRQRETTLARRLFLVVFTDFCCWFPIGVLGLLARNGMPISGQVNVWVVIFVLPLNSALNPFLYTLNGLRQQWQQRSEERKMRQVLSRLQTEVGRWPAASVQELVKVCLQTKAVDREVVSRWLGLQPAAQHQGGPRSQGVSQADLPHLPDSSALSSHLTEVTVCGVTDSGVTDSGVTGSGVTDSRVTDSEVTGSGVTDSGLTDSGVPGSGVTGSGVTDNRATDSGVTDSG